MVLKLDDTNHVVQLRGDHSHPMSEGYACIKGLQAADAANGSFRILRLLKRLADGSFVEIDIELALGEIADTVRRLVAERGPRSVALFKGAGA
jgi:anaerobic selenocysteine-containing dehydrogenase